MKESAPQKKLPELLSYRTDEALFPILETGYHCCITNPFCTNEHFHDFYELTYCMSGYAYHHINGQTVTIRDGSLFIIRPNDVHYCTDYDSVKALTVCIHPDEFHSFLKIYQLENCEMLFPVDVGSDILPPHFQVSNSDAPYLRHLCKNIIILPMMQRTPYLKLLLGHVLGLVIRQSMPNTHAVPNFLLDAITKMNDLENAKQGIEAFLALVNVSHAQLCRLTKKHLNMTPHEYVNSIRMQWASSLISDTDTPMEIIAEMVGFSSYSHFQKLFKETYGKSPVDFRRG